MWLSSEINYKRVRIYKNTIFGKREKLGYELTKPLRYKYKKDVFFVLYIGYVWDGPSYMKWLEWLVGNKNGDGSLAASAFHDIHDKIPTRYVTKKNDKKQMGYTVFNIKKGAKFYQKLLNEWPNKKETTTKFQAKIQRIGLIIFQPFYSIFSNESEWKKTQQDINN